MSLKNIRIFIILLFLFVLKTSFATHFIAGEITYDYLGPLTYKATITTYSEDNSATTAQDTIYLHWGDGTIESVVRTNGSIGGTGVPSGELIPGTTIVKNIYISNTHTYAGALPFYVIYIQEENRRNGIINVANGNSDQVPFYLEDTLKYLPPFAQLLRLALNLLSSSLLIILRKGKTLFLKNHILL